MRSRGRRKDLAKAIDLVIAYTDYVLQDRRSEHYLDNVILLYSLIENLVKWLVWAGVQRRRHVKVEQTTILRRFCRNLTFYDALRIALLTGLFDFDLCMKIDKVRTERNDLVHQLWIYEHWHNPSILRTKLERLAGIAKELLAVATLVRAS